MTRSRMLRPVVFLILALGGATAAWAARPAAHDEAVPTGDPSAETARAAVTIQIRLTGAGLQVTPASARVSRGDEIVWTSDLPFAVDVARNAELFGRQLPAAALRGRANAAARASTGRSAPAGSYKYAVAVWDGTNVWVLDPEIIISPN